VTRATVLGAAGFIGSRLQAALAARGVNVCTPSRTDDVTGEDLGTVFYCIGLTADTHERPFDTVTAHVERLSQVLRTARFDLLVYFSSARVYLGSTSSREVDPIRVDPLQPQSLYNLSKATGESLAVHSGKPVRIVRLSNVYGPDWDSQSFLSTVIAAACDDGRVTLRSSPQSAKDYVHVDDVVEWVIRIGEKSAHAAYNVASGVNVMQGEIVEELRRLTGCTVDLDSRARPVVFPPIDTSRLQAEFPASPRSVLADLPWLVDLYRKRLADA
jgi:nucleoside-diphosphate-sugar epimerase